MDIITDENFAKEVLQSDKPVVVDFFAEWCGPCRQMLPVVAQIAEERTDIKIFKMNVDEAPKTPVEYGVQSIPTFILFKQGQAVDMLVGSATKSEIVQWIDSKI
ncbi:MAG: thioredoxin [Alphaproteobacteria bacterium]|nr:thioredoxin [Alphaproteobacteria bacterium]